MSLLSENRAVKAVRVHEHGDVDKLIHEDIEVPRIAPNEVLVQVKACALNHIDLWVRQGLPTMKFPLPLVLGADIAGIVAEVGEVVHHLNVGDPVMVSPGVGCGHCQMCLWGQDHLCREYRVIGEIRDGGYAEYAAVPGNNVVPMPTNLSFEEAASIPLVFITAWNMLINKAQVKAGEDVLILAAGSGVGSAAVQIAKFAGARVIATAGSDEKLERARELGADEVINYSRVDFLEEVKRLTHRKGVEVVFEHTGKETWEKSFLALARGGRLVTCGGTTGPIVDIDLRHLFYRQLSIFGSTMGSRGDLMEILKFVRTGQLRPIIDQVFPLQEAAQAHLRLLERKQFGKVVLVP